MLLIGDCGTDFTASSCSRIRRALLCSKVHFPTLHVGLQGVLEYATKLSYHSPDTDRTLGKRRCDILGRATVEVVARQGPCGQSL